MECDDQTAEHGAVRSWLSLVEPGGKPVAAEMRVSSRVGQVSERVPLGVRRFFFTVFVCLVLSFTPAQADVWDQFSWGAGVWGSGNTFAIAVSKAGTGSGTVTSDVKPGIDCGSTCGASFTSGTTVTLSAAADLNSVFAGWSGSGCSGTGACKLTMNAGKSVTAAFNKKQFTLTVTKNGGGTGTVTSNLIPGIACGATCGASFPYGANVILYAVPDGGMTFAGWAGSGCSGLGTCEISMTAAMSVVATFNTVVNQYQVSVLGSDDGLITSVPIGIVCGNQCIAAFNSGILVTLSAQPYVGYTFAGWGGSCSGTGACPLLVNGPKSAIATFSPIPKLIFADGFENGTVAKWTSSSGPR